MNRQAQIDDIIRQVSAWDGVVAHPHRFGGTEFNLGNVEIGHIHAPGGLVDIPFTRTTRNQLVNAKLAEPHHLLDESGWISFWLGKTGDADAALRLYRLSYLQKRRRRDKAFTEAAYTSEIARLGLPIAV